MPGPLHGIRILDLTGMISGPMATMILADQGADVIKIEPPAGDLMRHYGVMRKGMSSSFLSNNHGKRSLTVDIKSPAGLEISPQAVATADVLVQNFRPGAIERMGLGEDVVRAVKPDIIFVSISGFGEHGPYADAARLRSGDPGSVGSCRDPGRSRNRSAAHGAHRDSGQDDGGDGGAGGHRGAVFPRAHRPGSACAACDAGYDGCVSLAGSQLQPQLCRRRGGSGARPDGSRPRVQDTGIATSPPALCPNAEWQGMCRALRAAGPDRGRTFQHRCGAIEQRRSSGVR